MAELPMLTELASRVRRRTYPGGRTVYWLDLRSEEWGGLGRLAVRKPGTPGWPHAGDTTDDPATARDWASHPAYAKLVMRQRTLNEHGAGVLTVREALDEYLAYLKQEKGRDHATYQNRATSLVRHTSPIHDRLLGRLNSPLIQAWLDGVRVGQEGDPREPARATKAALLRGLKALWSHHMGGIPAPFSGVKLGPNDRLLSIRRAVMEGRDLTPFIGKGAYNSDELRRLVVAARWYHREVIEPSPPLRAVTLDHVAEAIVLMTATSARLMEAARLQWQHVHEDEGLIIVPGTKTKAALRALPLQDSLRPWLRHLRSVFVEHYGRPPADLDFLIQSDPRAPRSQPVGRGLGERIRRIQEVAGLKRPQVSSHILRATFISSAHAQGIGRERLKHYIGHAAAEGEGSWDVTDHYIHFIAGLVQDQDRRIMDHIPCPQEVVRALPGFKPSHPVSAGAGADTGVQR